METIYVELPDSLHKNLKEIADRDSITINQFITSALSEKISAFMTQEYLEARAKRGSKKKFLETLAKVPDVEPEEGLFRLPPFPSLFNYYNKLSMVKSQGYFCLYMVENQGYFVSLWSKIKGIFVFHGRKSG